MDCIYYLPCEERKTHDSSDLTLGPMLAAVQRTGAGRGGAGAAGAESWGGSLQGCVLHGHRHYCRLMACALAGAPHHTARTSVYCPAPVLATSPAQPAPGENTVLPAPPCQPAQPAQAPAAACVQVSEIALAVWRGALRGGAGAGNQFPRLCVSVCQETRA